MSNQVRETTSEIRELNIDEIDQVSGGDGFWGGVAAGIVGNAIYEAAKWLVDRDWSGTGYKPGVRRI